MPAIGAQMLQKILYYQLQIPKLCDFMQKICNIKSRVSNTLAEQLICRAPLKQRVEPFYLVHSWKLHLLNVIIFPRSRCQMLQKLILLKMTRSGHLQTPRQTVGSLGICCDGPCELEHFLTVLGSSVGSALTRWVEGCGFNLRQRMLAMLER